MIILIFILSFISCEQKEEEKKGEWTALIEGQILDYYSGDKLSNIGLIIEECQSPSVTGSLCKVIDTIYSDSTGEFYHELIGKYSNRFDDNGYHKVLDDKDYQISVLFSNYYANSEVEEIKIENSNYYIFNIKPLRQILLILHDSSSNYDKLHIGTSFSGCTENNNLSLNDLFSQDTILEELNSVDSLLLKSVPESDVYITLRYYRDGIYEGNKTTHEYIKNSDQEQINIKY